MVGQNASACGKGIIEIAKAFVMGDGILSHTTRSGHDGPRVSAAHNAVRPDQQITLKGQDLRVKHGRCETKGQGGSNEPRPLSSTNDGANNANFQFTANFGTTLF